MWIVIFDAQERRKVEQFVDVLEHECDVVEAVALLVLDLQIGGAIVRARDVELLHLLSRENVEFTLYSADDLENLEGDNLVKKGVISVSLRLCMQVNLMFFVLHEHETLEADAWVALLLPALVHLGGHPLDVRVVILERWLNLGQLFLHLEADMALSHFLADLVDDL